jgi:hypothetical protein
VIDFTKEGPTKDSSSKNSVEKGGRSIPRLTAHLDTLDQGMEAFMQWLRFENKMSNTSNLITLKEFVHTKYSVLYDNTIGQTVTVELAMVFRFARVVMQMTADMWGLLYFLNRNMKPMAV